MTRIFSLLLVAFVAAPVPVQDRPAGCETAQTCCCTMANGLQCCGASVNCASGAVSGCPCGPVVAPG